MQCRCCMQVDSTADHTGHSGWPKGPPMYPCRSHTLHMLSSCVVAATMTVDIWLWWLRNTLWIWCQRIVLITGYRLTSPLNLRPVLTQGPVNNPNGYYSWFLERLVPLCWLGGRNSINSCHAAALWQITFNTNRAMHVSLQHTADCKTINKHNKLCL